MISFYRTKYFNLLLIFVFINLQLIVNAQSINFNRLTTNNGLSNNYVSNLIQDRLGFLWFATDDGLNRFDGYDFKVFRNNPSDKSSISDNSTFAITEDDSGRIWIGTKIGYLNCYDPVLDKFIYWKIESEITKDNSITNIHIDKKFNVWIGTYRSGLYKLDTKTGKTLNWTHKKDDPKSLSNNYISSIVEDDFGNLWIGTFNGLNQFNPNKSNTHFVKYFFDKNNPNSLSDNIIWGIAESKSEKNKLWLGTANGLTILNTETKNFSRINIPNPDNLQFGNGTGTVVEEIVDGESVIWINSYAGMLRYNVTRNRFDRFLSDKENPNSLTSNQVNNIIKDRSGVLWIATDNGLSYFSQKSIKFNNSLLFSDRSVDLNKLDKLNVKAITKSSDGTLWIGTDNGLYFSSNVNGKLLLKKHSALASENIWSLTAGNSNDLWIGTYGSGLFHLNYKTNQLTGHDILLGVIKSTSRNFVKSVFKDDKNNLWIGYWGVGLAKLNLSTGKVQNWLHQKDNMNSLSHDDVWTIFQDSKKRIWIGTNGGGLNLYDESNGGKFSHYSFKEGSKNSLSSNSVYSIVESKNKNFGNNNTILWVGTSNGLNKLVINNSDSKNISQSDVKVTFYTTKDGLTDNSIKSIVEDENGNLWLGTSSGITLFDLSKNTFTNFSTSDGVIGTDFNFTSSFKLNDNLIIIGSTAGLNYFNPNRISQSSYKPAVVLTDFLIFNNSVKAEANSILSKNIFNTDEVTLSHKQNVFSFQFSALDYNNPASIKYAYKMEGFDKGWIQSGTRRFITYTNLNPGKYTFKVKSTNSDGIWNSNETSLAVIITPPWWQTGWAILLYFIVFVLGVWAIFKFQNYRTKLQHELKFRELESYHLREIEQMKSRFFANLSHEFRTPLMLIKGPLEELLRGRIKENLTDYYKMLLRNTEKLQQLIDQLLELSQLESESIPLKKEAYDVVILLRSISNAFIPLADQKNIKFNFNSNMESAFALLDKDKFEKIVNNLLSNAFKFTDVGGTVNTEVVEKIISDKKFALVSVSDSGVGITKENQSKIFNRFFQVDDSSKRNYGGSGIGLALVKELTTLLGWDISVNSSEGEGTEFTLKIPLLSQKEIQTSLSSLNYQDDQSKLVDQVDFEKSDDDYQVENNSKPLLLFVEDQIEVRDYVLGLLKQDYNVLQAENGKAGFDVAINSLPDLIISDVMMPVMDGIELCKKLKTDWKTSHIPVILLTAKATQQSKLEGLEFGADDYLTKPFDFEELSIRIKNLITQRKHLKEKFSKEISLNAESFTTNNLDKDFIEKINKIIETHLQDENFTSENLAQELFVSRSQLNRKLSAVIGKGPGEFIRIYKLKRAAHMILENKLSITQIALEVGFSSPAQFTRAFQKHYNCSPSEFKQIKM